MKTITGRISVGKSKFTISIDTSGKEELEENGQESNRVRLGAHAAIKITDSRVSYMTLVIRSVKVYPIPARWEINLPSHGLAFHGRKTGLLVVCIKAHNMDGSLRDITVVLSTSSRITSNHPESIGKSHRNNGLIAGLGGWRVITSPLLIIHI